MHSRRCGDQQAFTGRQFVDQKFSEQFVFFVNLNQLEVIEPNTCTTMANIRLQGSGSNGRETISTSWAFHFQANLPFVDRNILCAEMMTRMRTIKLCA